MPNFGPLSRGQPHSPDVNHCVLHFQPDGHWEPCNKVGSLRLAKHIVGFELGTFWFLLQCLNPLGYSLLSLPLILLKTAFSNCASSIPKLCVFNILSWQWNMSMDLKMGFPYIAKALVNTPILDLLHYGKEKFMDTTVNHLGQVSMFNKHS